MRLFSYIVAHDNGAAPNPFGGVCTLVICKPRIRKAAKVGDWIAGFGSKHSGIGDLSGQMVYAMQVSQKVTLEEYDALALEEYPEKTPVMNLGQPVRMVGDAIYDYSVHPPRPRKGVHGYEQMDRDLSGKFALLSNKFVYFGRTPKKIPPHLLPIVPKRQGHQSNMNAAYLAPFLDWLNGLSIEWNTIYGKPVWEIFDEVDLDVKELQVTCA